MLTDSPIMMVNSSSPHHQHQHQHQHHHHHQQQQLTTTQPSATLASSSSSSAPASIATAISNSNCLHYDGMKLAGMNSVLYPSTLANIPQDVLLSLVQAGHLQLHTEEGKLRISVYQPHTHFYFHSNISSSEIIELGDFHK